MTNAEADLTAPTFKADLLALLPPVRAFARSLSVDASSADDLVQEVLVKAWSNRSRFTLGSNMKAWLFTITRNQYYDRLRKERRNQSLGQQIDPNSISTPSAQMGRVELNELERALLQLKEEQREAVILVGASGFSYEEAAEIAGVAVGTIKSRVSRAREHLSELLG